MEKYEPDAPHVPRSRRPVPDHTASCRQPLRQNTSAAPAYNRLQTREPLFPLPLHLAHLLLRQGLAITSCVSVVLPSSMTASYSFVLSVSSSADLRRLADTHREHPPHPDPAFPCVRSFWSLRSPKLSHDVKRGKSLFLIDIDNSIHHTAFFSLYLFCQIRNNLFDDGICIASHGKSGCPDVSAATVLYRHLQDIHHFPGSGAHL